MLIEPTVQERAKDRNAPTRVIVDTWSTDRVAKPLDSDMHDTAFEAAFRHAEQGGYEAVAFSAVTEFYQRDPLTGEAGYRYVWEFTVHKS